MPRVHLVQCLCPARHCIMAATVQEPPGTEAEGAAILKTAIEEAIASGRINPVCALCKAPRDQWAFEIATIEGVTFEQIRPGLEKQESEMRDYQAQVRAQARAARN